MTSTSPCSGTKDLPWWTEAVTCSREEFILRLEGEIRNALRDVVLRIALTDELVPTYVLALHKVDRGAIVAEVLEKLGKEFRHDD